MLTSFIVLGFLSSCKKELPTEVGEWKDSYIVEFALTVQGVTYQGAIEGSKITVQVPEGVELKGAEVQCKLSEGASIEPDPKSVSDWSAERQFVVTSRSQESRKYMYSPLFKKLIQDGSIVLATQSDVDKIREKRLTAIEGDLIIGTVRGEKITNLEALAYLKQVGGALKINDSYDGGDFSGLRSLEKVGSFLLGSLLDTSKCEKVKEVSLPSLSEVLGDFVVNCGTVESVSIPKVKSINGDMLLKSRTLKSVDVNLLEEVRGSLVLHGAMKTSLTNGGSLVYTSDAAIEAVSFNVLSSIGGKLEVQYFGELEGVYFPLLKRVGGSLKINSIDKLGNISLSELAEVGGVECSENSKLQKISFPNLKKCMGYFYVVNGDDPMELDVSSLEVQDGDMELMYLKCKEVKLNPSFDLKGHQLKIVGNKGLEKLSGPSTLNGSLNFEWVNSMSEGFTVEGISKLTGSLIIRSCQNSKFLFSFIEVDGSLDLECDGNTINMKKLQKVGKFNCKLEGNNKSEYDFSSIKEVVNSYFVSIKGSIPITLSSLEKVGGDFTVKLSWSTNNGSFACPKLSVVDGAFEFAMQNKYMKVPTAYTIDFSGLTSVKSVSIQRQQWLTDFTMFKGLFAGEKPAMAAADNWNVQDCGYNPTYDDMKKGYYTQDLKDKGEGSTHP